MSLSDYLDSVPPGRREQARAEFEALPDTDGSPEDLFEQAAYERSVALDPNGRRLSRVLLRLSGDATANASIDDATAGEIVGAFGREVRAAAGPSAEDALLRLVGFSAGSVVLHYEPVRSVVVEDGAFDVHSVADHAIETVMALHQAIESGQAAGQIQATYKQPGLLKAARRFLAVLDKDGLDVSTRWYGPGGGVSTSAVTTVGRRYALDILFESDVESEPEPINGLVTSLDIEGYVTIRSGNKKPSVRVPPELITDGSFQIGKYTQIKATKTYNVDKVGITGKASYDFVEFAFSDGTPPLDIAER